MQLHLTNGKVGLTVHFHEAKDMKACRDIRSSPRPIRTAMQHAMQRLNLDLNDGNHDYVETVGTWYPVADRVALEGLDAA